MPLRPAGFYGERPTRYAGVVADTTTETDLQALERFIVDNDDLLALEEAIGRFNIFDALGVARAEIRHSNFLAWLLDPSESHGQGDLFLKAVLMDLLRQAPPSLRPLSPVELDGVEMQGVEIRREWEHIDLCIVSHRPSFVVAIENKVDSGEHSNQLRRYKDTIGRHFASLPALFVFLTPDGDEASDDDWVSYSYADLHRVLQRVARIGAGAIGTDVAVFLEHYLRLIGSRFMQDPKIDELCQRIYKNHRQALDLLFERCGGGSGPIFQACLDSLRAHPDKWYILNTTSKRIDFVPAGWERWIPPLCSRPKQDPRFWIRLWISCAATYSDIVFEIAPCKDAELRKRVVDRFRQHPEEFPFVKQKLKVTDNWTRLFRIVIQRWDDGDPPEVDEFMPKFEAALSKAAANLKGAEQALRQVCGV